MATSSYERSERTAAQDERGVGWVMFAGIMLLIAGVLNVLYGIAAVDNSKFLYQGTQYIFSDLNTWGWVTIVLGGLEILAAFSIWAGGEFGRWFGVIIASLSVIGALLSIQAYPFWALTIFAIDILIIYGLVSYGGRSIEV
jgi:hypothetical protein